jgi:hypothetical protein
MESQTAAAPETPQPKGALWRLQGIFFEPSATFEDINLRPGFIVPLVAAMVIAFVTWQLLSHFVDLQEVLMTQIRNSPQAANASPEQLRTGLNLQLIILKYLVPVLVPIMALIYAGVFMLMVWISGSETTFSKLLSSVSYTVFFQTLVGSVLLLVVFALAQDPNSINLQNPVFTNPGPLVSAKTSPVLYSLLSSVDIVSFYVIFLFGLGISKVSRRMSTGKGVTLVAIPFLIYVAIKVGITALTT